MPVAYLGYIPFSKARAELLSEVAVSHAYKYQSLIVTSNLPFDTMNDDVGLRTTDGRTIRPLNPPMSYHRGKRGKLLFAPGSGETKTASTANLTLTRRNTSSGQKYQ
jgi:hypothetical protein